MRDLIIVPTARLVAPELQAEFGPIPPALIPLGGRPAYAHICDRLSSSTNTVVLAASDGIDILTEKVSMDKRSFAEIVDVGHTTSLGATILRTIEHLDTTGVDRLVINFADTLVGVIPTTGNFFSSRTVTNTYRWTSFEIQDGLLFNISDKNSEKALTADVFVGVFGFTDIECFYEMLREACNTEEDLDSFYRALLSYSTTNPLSRDVPMVWHDFGHIDTYYATRQQLFLNKRFFNSVEVDAKRGAVRKRSTDVTKFANEIQWYAALPPNLRHLAPRVFDSSLRDDDMFVDMEFYGYPPLAESYLHGNWDSGVWAQAFTTIQDTISEMQDHSITADRDLLLEMYEVKTRSRVAAISGDHFETMFSQTTVVNGAITPGVSTAMELLAAVCNKVELFDRDTFGVLHGDMCLSNILFDRRTSIVRLIDPRGSFGRDASIYGDALYDYAKLSHSFLGSYDHIVNDMFNLEVSTAGVWLEPHVTQHQAMLNTQFDAWLHEVTKADYLRVRTIEALLFLSMVPLHADHPRRQQAFLATGLQLFGGIARRLGLWHPTRSAMSEPRTQTSK